MYDGLNAASSVAADDGVAAVVVVEKGGHQVAVVEGAAAAVVVERQHAVARAEKDGHFAVAAAATDVEGPNDRHFVAVIAGQD